MKELKRVFWIIVVLWLGVYLGLESAEADVLSLHVASNHLVPSKLDPGFNEFNPGAGYAFNIHEHVRINGGYYYNSNREDTYYLGPQFFQRTGWPFLTEAGIDWVFITGYEFPVGASCYVRLADTLKVHAIPFVVDEGDKPKYEGITLGFSIAFGE